MTKEKVKRGKILLAEPFMLDTNFRRSVVLLCEHQDEDGTVGFILNKALEMNVSDLIADFPDFEADVYFGGPVQTDTIHYIHNAGDLLEDSHKVAKGVYWGGDFEKLKFLISSGLIQASNIRFFVGYSGWSSGQLQEEMQYGSWVLADMHPNYLFKAEPGVLWKQIMENKGNTFSVIAQMPEDVSWN
jgi:putative transcriptional regulator